MKKIFAIVLSVCMLLSLFTVTAFAVDPIPGDVNGDGKVTPFDALQVQSHLHGEISLTDAQIARALAACEGIDTLSTAHIVAIFFKPLTGQNAQAPEADGLYHIRSASDMALLRSFPYAGFSLDADIDMSATSWTPMIFNGVLLGGGHTISNLTVSAASGNINAGALFTKLGAANNTAAAVRDLTLAGASLTTASAHQYAGLVAGTNYGTISNVSIDGGTIQGAINANNAVGAEAGMNYGAVSSQYADFTLGYACNNDNLVGANQAAGSVSTSDSYVIRKNGTTVMDIETRDPEPMNRQTVVDKMYAMSQVLWYVTEPSLVRESDCTFDIRANRNYKGMPYSHYLGSLENIETNTVSIVNGNHQINNKFTCYVEGSSTSTTQTVPMDELFLGHIMGADCSSAVINAWRTVCTNATAVDTSTLVPTAANIKNNGLVKLGNYSIPTRTSATKAVSNVPDYSTAWDVNYATDKDLPVADRNYLYCSVVSNDDGSINAEKLNDLYEGYALCQPGDAIDCSTYGHINGDGSMRSAGHARLVSAYPTVVRDSSGKIDPANSYLTTIEQGGGGGGINSKSNKGENGNDYSSWGVNISYSFRDLAGIENATAAKPNYACYVPVSCSQLLNPMREATQFKLKDSSSPLSGVVASNFAILSTEVTIDGVSDLQYTAQHSRGTTSVPYEARDESGTMPTVSGRPNRFLYKSVSLAKHADAFGSLASGTHTYSITVTLISGESKTYTGTFTN